MRKNMFDRLLEMGLAQERADLAMRVAERLQGYSIPDSIGYIRQICEGNPQPVDVYMPKEPGSYPALVNIHGGGLVLGSNLQNMQYCVHMAERGYIVLAVDYAHAPEVTVMTQLSQIASGINGAGKWLKSYSGWNGKLYGVGDSAGAWLLMQTCAISVNDEIAAAWGATRSEFKFDKVAFQNGMFYATRRDMIGKMTSKCLGPSPKKAAFYKYLNPELPEMINSLPPFFMMTSAKDYLRNYSEDFAAAVRKVRSDFVYNDYPDFLTLGHADSATMPFMEESRKVNDDIDKFFAQ